MTEPTPDIIHETARDLRRIHAQMPPAKSQDRAVTALSSLAANWADPAYPPRLRAEGLSAPLPYAMVKASLDALLESFAADRLWRLIDDEAVRAAAGPPVIGHIAAGNTPLLSWTTIARALLVGSTSLVKLSSRAGADWSGVFLDSLHDADPGLAVRVVTMTWPGGSEDLDGALCAACDLIVAYGADSTLDALQAYVPDSGRFLGYGHRVSFGLVPAGAIGEQAMRGFARDIVTYDQGGCLSPQTIFVEGGWDETVVFADGLAAALPAAVAELGLPERTLAGAAAVRRARALAVMQDGVRVWAGERALWTVIARHTPVFAPSPAYCVISVQPLASFGDLSRSLAPVAGRLQGCAVAARRGEMAIDSELAGALAALRISYICRPGEMQTPPLSWREDGRSVLASLIH